MNSVEDPQVRGDECNQVNPTQEVVPRNEAYKRFGFYTAINGVVGLVGCGIVSLIVTRRPILRSIIMSGGTGMTVGWCLHETDDYFRNPEDQSKLPKAASLVGWIDGQRECITSKISHCCKLLPESWKPKARDN